MSETTNELEELKGEIGEITKFVKERVEPVHDERVRLRKALEGLLETQKDQQRAALLTAGESEGDGVVKSGPYSGMDALDLGIMKSVHQAAARQAGPESVKDWDVRIKAALTSTGVLTGDELVPTGMAAQMWDDVNLETRVASLFPRVNMPTNPFDVPLQLGDVNWYPGAENTATTQTAAPTAKQTLTAYELVAEVPWSLTLEEDAVVAMLPEVRRTLVREAAEVLDDVVLNADTTAQNGINADGATLTTASAGKAHFLIGFDGLVHQGLVDNSAQSKALGGKISAAEYLAIISKLGKYGLNPDESVFVTDIMTFVNSLGLTEVETVEKFGPRATIKTGQLASVYGHPLIVSGQMRVADADGKVTDGGNTKDTGRLLGVNTSQWRVGYRRSLMIETDRDIQKRQNTMVVSLRVGFAERTGKRASATHTALTYNLTG